MKLHVKVIYGFSLTLVFFMLTLFYTHETSNEYVARDEAACSILTDYDVTSYENESAPVGITQEYKWTLTDVPSRGGAVVFYLVHQEAEVYIGNELVYSLASSEDNFFSKTVGYKWAKAYLYPEDEGKEIRILVHPIYKTSIKNELTIHYGDYNTISAGIIRESLPLLIIGIISIIIGIIFIAFILVNHKNHEIDASLAMLGVFSIFAGLWKLSDMFAAPLLFKDSVMLSALSIISISVMIVSYIYFIRNQFAKTKPLYWDFLCIACNLVCILIVILQLCGIADLRQTLPLCHAMILIAALFMLTMLFWEVRHKTLSSRLKTTCICCIICLLGASVDMIVYYFSGNSGSMIYGLLAFLIYVVAMGYISLREALQLIERGKEAKRFEQLAMHDGLTGLYNRAFYAQYLKKNNVQQSDCFIVMFDVNDLKKCNDTLGHDCGDRLLCNSARLLEKAFLPDGECIRMGGDEFCVLLKHATDNKLQAYLRKFDELLEEFNKTHPDDFPIKIAYGYTHFDAEEDFDFSDTLRRADKWMYQMKLEMKTEKI